MCFNHWFSSITNRRKKYLPDWLIKVEIQELERGLGPEGKDVSVIRSEHQGSGAEITGRHEGAERRHGVVAAVEHPVARDEDKVVSREDDKEVVVKDVNGARILAEVEIRQSEVGFEKAEIIDVVGDNHRETKWP